MKKTRRYTAIIAAMTLSLTMAVPASMMTAFVELNADDAAKLAAMQTLVDAAENKNPANVSDWGKYSLAEYNSLVAMNTASASGTTLKIKSVGSVPHTFEVYQIMTGTYDSTENTFSELKWGNGLTAYTGDADLTDDSKLVPDSVLNALTGNGFDARTLITGNSPTITLSSNKTTVTGTGNVTIYGLTPGYYIVKDVTNLDGKDDANSAWIIDIAGPQEVNIKNETPSVDKQVYDDADGSVGAGWSEAADHAINEGFQFKLTATIPANDFLKDYSTYALTFTDTMSAGVTFDSIESVVISSNNTLKDGSVITLETNDYTESATEAANKAGLSWTLGIADVKSIVNSGNADIFGSEEITVEVIYNAHLNENAICSNASSGSDGAATNNNKVKLTYSNNPDATGTGTNNTGETPEDYVWVFAYKVENTKYKISATDGNELADATFKLYTDTSHNNEVELIFDENKNVYRPIKSGETATVMTSADSKGIFILGATAKYP